MSEQVVLFLVAQAVVILLAVAGAFWRLSAQLSTVKAEVGELRVSISHYAEQRREGYAAHLELVRQTAAISRVVERHDTLIGILQQPGG